MTDKIDPTFTSIYQLTDPEIRVEALRLAKNLPYINTAGELINAATAIDYFIRNGKLDPAKAV
jgi:hypothetical protein